MRRPLRLATLLLASTALVPACLIDAGPFQDTGAGGTGGTGATGGTGGTGATGATGGTGGAGGSAPDCGDGKIESPEQCDGGDTDAGDGCSSDCKLESGWSCTGEPSKCKQTCGDGKLDEADGEECDDGNVALGDGCNQGCQTEPGWACSNPDGPMMVSVCAETCGNSALDTGEECDDQNQVADDGCSDTCVIEAGWLCINDPLPSNCFPECGDGVILTGEACDDGDTDGAAGCNEACNGPVAGWQCDDRIGGAESCTPVCGDGLLVGDEAGNQSCDDGNTTSGDGCSADCKPESTCPNGIVDPTEECDGNPMLGTQCKADCTLEPESVCGKAIVITPSAVADPETGIRTTVYEGDSDPAAAQVSVADVPMPIGCDISFNNVMLHTYTTGSRPSILTLETLNAQPIGGANTFNNSQIWVFRDCPRKADYEGCDNDSAAEEKLSKMTTGLIPALTTLFIVVSGEGGGGEDKGPYALSIMEQPVKLFFHEDFGNDESANIQPIPADLTVTTTGDGGWVTCFEGTASPCILTSLGSHSGGPLGWAYGKMDLALTRTVLQTPVFDLTGLTNAHAQYTFKFTDGGGSDSGKVEPMDGANPVGGTTVSYTSNKSGRERVPLPNVAAASVQFTHDDGANTGAGIFAVDDIYIYGY